MPSRVGSVPTQPSSTAASASAPSSSSSTTVPYRGSAPPAPAVLWKRAAFKPAVAVPTVPRNPHKPAQPSPLAANAPAIAPASLAITVHSTAVNAVNAATTATTATPPTNAQPPHSSSFSGVAPPPPTSSPPPPPPPPPQPAQASSPHTQRAHTVTTPATGDQAQATPGQSSTAQATSQVREQRPSAAAAAAAATANSGLETSAASESESETDTGYDSLFDEDLPPSPGESPDDPDWRPSDEEPSRPKTRKRILVESDASDSDAVCKPSSRRRQPSGGKQRLEAAAARTSIQTTASVAQSPTATATPHAEAEPEHTNTPPTTAETATQTALRGGAATSATSPANNTLVADAGAAQEAASAAQASPAIEAHLTAALAARRHRPTMVDFRPLWLFVRAMLPQPVLSDAAFLSDEERFLQTIHEHVRNCPPSVLSKVSACAASSVRAQRCCSHCKADELAQSSDTLNPVPTPPYHPDLCHLPYWPMEISVFARALRDLRRLIDTLAVDIVVYLQYTKESALGATEALGVAGGHSHLQVDDEHCWVPVMWRTIRLAPDASEAESGGSATSAGSVNLYLLRKIPDAERLEDLDIVWL